MIGCTLLPKATNQTRIWFSLVENENEKHLPTPHRHKLSTTKFAQSNDSPVILITPLTLRHARQKHARAMAAFITPVPTSSTTTTFRRSQISTAPCTHPNRRGRQACSARRARLSPPTAKLDALIFDCDGVLADTERDGHRKAFNLAFAAEGLHTVWDERLYGRLLETGGGKERMTAYWNDVGWPSVLSTPDEREAAVKRLHAAKTELFMRLVDNGEVPLRAGVQRLVDEAIQQRVVMAVCSTSNERAVTKIVRMLNGGASEYMRVFAGDIVQRKKPAGDIYKLAQKELALDANRVCVIEDSFIGVSAAREAGMACVVTRSTYTAGEDFSDAQLVLDSLDEPFTTLDELTALVDGLRVR